MLENKKTYITGGLIIIAGIAKIAVEYMNTGNFNPLGHSEELLAGLGLIFARRGMKKEADSIKARL